VLFLQKRHRVNTPAFLAEGVVVDALSEEENLMQNNFAVWPWRSAVARKKRRTLRLGTLLFLLGVGLVDPRTAHGDGGFYVISGPSSSTATFELSADGSVAVGISNGVAWRWSVDGGLQPLTPANSRYTFGAAVSADGSTVVSSLLNPDSGYGEAARWTADSDWQFLGGLPEGGEIDSQLSTGYGVSGDGSIVVGLAWLPNGRAEAFQYTDADGMVGLIGGLPSYSSRASKISADGSTIVGWYGSQSFDRRPTRWINGGDPDLFLGDVLGEATAANSDGSFIVGGAIANGAFSRTAFIYSDGSGWTDLGVLDPTDLFSQSFANGVSDSGTVVGWSGDPLGFGDALTGFVWTVDGGMVSATDYLAAYGVNVPANYLIDTVTCISADGTVLGGQAIDTNAMAYVAWVAVIQP
jgi:probable HAF family extracellular repeat protein